MQDQGVRCKRHLNVSAPVSHPVSSQSDGDHDDTPLEGAAGSNPLEVTQPCLQTL